ncbi:MAG: lipid-A-disaccharide synthase [Bdellovibrionales bacterium]|jgi:lipid-A-disaccharide synthase|nr:lipid-A-disaccharide synthase [Bdellovibrionales bacterium]
MAKQGRALIVAGEASSSLYAQRLIELWKSQGKEYDLFGIGSREMEALGFRRLGKSEELAVVGLQEVIRHFPLIRRTYKDLLAECDREKPDFALLLDYPDFNLRLAADLKKRGIKVVYYISPQVWAWRKGRVKQIRKIVDEMLVLFPFEETFYRERGVEATFVGHPLLDELKRRPSLSNEERLTRRRRFGIQDHELILGLMPGSRESELKNHLTEQLEAAELLTRRYQSVRPVLLCAPTIERERLQFEASRLSVTIQIIKEEPLDMIELSDIVLVASGTATLMVGLMMKPMVIMYRMNAVTAWLAKRLVKDTKYFGMANLILGREVARELFQEEASPAGMATELEKLLSDDVRATKVRELSELRERLGSAGATERVAERLAKYFHSSIRSASV